jgi:amino acid transporter
MTDPRKETGEPRTLNFFQTISAVLWSFVGLRSGAASRADTRLNPLHLIVAAIVLVAVFIFVLLMIVRAVVS